MFKNELEDKLNSIFIDKLDYKLMFCIIAVMPAVFGINVLLIHIIVFGVEIWVICAFCYVIVWNGILRPVIKKNK